MYTKFHRHFQISALIFIVLAITANLFLLASQKVFAKNIGIVKIAGVDLFGKTTTQAEKTLENELWAFSQKGTNLNLGEKQFHPSLDQMGIIINPSRLASNALFYGKTGDYYLRFVENSKMLFGGKNLPLDATIDKAKLFSYLEYIGGDQVQQPQNAALHFSNNGFVITPEKNGKSIDHRLVSQELLSRLKKIHNLNTASTPNIALSIAEIPAKIKQGDLVSVQNKTNKLIGSPYIFSYKSKIFNATSADIARWIDFVEVNRTIEPKINDNSVNTYLNKIAYQIDIPVTNKVVEFTNNKKVVKIEGKPGSELDRDSAIKAIKEGLGSDSREIALAMLVVNPIEKIIYPDTPPTGGMFDGKYIEINISAKQRMYLWEGKKLIATHIISSGKPGYYTPTGIFHIMSKSIRAYSKKYGLYMPYWNQFTSMGHGIHELPEWPSGYKEGAAHLGLRVSHGCVRLGVGPAAHLYYWAPIGTPIYIHY